MNYLLIFWLLVVLSIVMALAFVLPPLLRRRQYILAILISGFVPGLAYWIYSQVGSGQHLHEYYSPGASAQRDNNVLMRPFYSRIQRAIVKNELGIKLDPDNIDLILNFAAIHSKLSEGYLQDSIKSLLQAILEVRPQQVTALNLLAVNAYKTENYRQAAEYWQRIVDAFPEHMRGGKEEQILKNKIRTCAKQP